MRERGLNRTKTEKSMKGRKTESEKRLGGMREGGRKKDKGLGGIKGRRRRRRREQKRLRGQRKKREREKMLGSMREDECVRQE